MATPGQDNFDNKNSVEQNWGNNENNERNWFRRTINSLFWKEKAEKNEVGENAGRETSNLMEDVGNEKLDDLHNKIEFTFEQQGIIEDTRDALDDFFEAGKKEFSDDIQPIDEEDGKKINYEAEVEALMNLEKFKNRPLWVIRGIAQSSEKIKDEIVNRKKQENPVAKSLFRIINRIMGTEK